MRMRALGLIVAIAAVACAHAGAAEEKSMGGKADGDRAEIIRHIRSIFEAYLRKDRAAIRRTHARDWVGFLGPSTKIERGIDDYMAGADRSLESFDGLGYELLDTEVQLYGDLGLVYYTARYDFQDHDGHKESLPLRSLDVYRREGGGWIQAGSHITPIPSGGRWGEGEGTQAPSGDAAAPGSLSGEERTALLADREAVWRAWFAGDMEGLGRALPAELIAVDAGGGPWGSREETLRASADFTARGGKLVRLDFPQTEIQSYGEVAILFTKYELVTEQEGKRSEISGRGTEVFVRRDGRWVNTAWHLDSGE